MAKMTFKRKINLDDESWMADAAVPYSPKKYFPQTTVQHKIKGLEKPGDTTKMNVHVRLKGVRQAMGEKPEHTLEFTALEHQPPKRKKGKKLKGKKKGAKKQQKAPEADLDAETI